MISWIPVDFAAASIIEMLGSQESVLHLVHSRPVPWSVFSNTVSQCLGLPIIPFEEWVSKLIVPSQSKKAEIVSGPAASLVDYFKRYQVSGAISTEKAENISPSLRGAEVLCAEDVRRWIKYWRFSGFLTT